MSSYNILNNVTGSINALSFLDDKDRGLFYVTQSADLWFGDSPNDVIEISTYNVDRKEQINWSTINQKKEYKSITLSYLDNLNVIQTFSYNQLVSDYIQYDNTKLLVNPISDLNEIGITTGNFNVSYAFIRQMAGSPNSPLSIKEISPSRTEVKLVPVGNADTSYTAFCLGKFTVREVAEPIIKIIENCPYDKIYQTMFSAHANKITSLKSIFFLKDDSSVITFLKNLYEDYIKYTSLTNDQIKKGFSPTTILRIQGIRSYFKNYVYQNYDSIGDFSTLESKIQDFINFRLDQQFNLFKSQTTQNYKDARQFIFDFFFKYFYQNSIEPLKNVYQSKYYGYLKNVINFGNNQYYNILKSDYIDERESNSDPLTLILKLSTELPSDISTKDNCWITNHGMVPYVFTARLQNPVTYPTTKISAPNFGVTNKFITTQNINKMYSSDDLSLNNDIGNMVSMNKKTTELNTDFSDFNNFIIFSSVSTRINIFKKKMIEWTVLSSSLSSLNDRYNTSLSSSAPYPYYITERDSITSTMAEIIGSFDGYESYMFNGKNYNYSVKTKSFVSSSFVNEQDAKASLYDRNNRDSLISNVPEYLITDSENEDYLVFLAMTGHHFDNIYTYIAAMPIERQIKNELNSSISTNTLKEVLYSFGWNLDDIIGDLNLDEVYLNSLNLPSYNTLSAEQRLHTIWNRILITLPGIYKTKGTEECVKYLMSCYGLPSSLISIREYGGTDYSETPQSTYELDEKTYMLTFSGVNDYVTGPMPSNINTVEFKFSVESGSYKNHEYTTLFSSVPYPYSSPTQSAWSIGITKLPGTFLGQVRFSMGSGSSFTSIDSDVLPIFNGDIFSVMLRKNDPNLNFEFSPNPNSYPLIYDLIVQRNENGRKIFYSTSSVILNVGDNTIFNQFGKFQLSDGKFTGTIDKLSIWDVPIDDNDFEEHVNDINSYGFNGSLSYKNLLVRLSLDYPRSMYYNLSGSSAVWINNESTYYSIPNYYADPLNLSSSINPILYTASVNIINERWLSYIPTGSVKIIGYNFPPVVSPNWSASFNAATCNWVSSSVYPYHYRELVYQQNIDASKFGPNKYKNKRIKQLSYTLNARLDSQDRSTSQNDITVSGESNLLGFFVDPQDSKNKDIIRYVGKSGVMNLIGDPANLYSDSYVDLKNKNYEYNYSGNKRTYFNELITVYKFYFDKSIFQAIKNVLPARANSFTGIVIEPTILERPKYKNKQITSSAAVTYFNPISIDNIYSFSEGVLWSNFNTDWSRFTSQSQNTIIPSLPPSYDNLIDLTRINEPLRIKSNNINLGYVTDEMDVIQRGSYGDYENCGRGWEPNLQCQNWIYGSVSGQKTSDLPQIGTHHIPVGFDETGIAAGTSHQILYYMLKVWNKYSYYAKTGEYMRTDNPNDDKYTSASVFLYNYIMVDERFMNRHVHFFNEITTSAVPINPSYNVTTIGGTNYYTHASNTFKNTPDQTVSNTTHVFTTLLPTSFPTQFDIVLTDDTTYFELVKGYPRNHASHKIIQFSKLKQPKFITLDTNVIYVKGRNTINDTVNENGNDDGTFPVQSFSVNNVSVVNSSNVVMSVPSTNAGLV